MDKWSFIQINHMIEFHDILPSKYWYKADDVAELVRHVLPYIKEYENQNRAMYTNYGLAEIMGLIARLEQIAGK